MKEVKRICKICGKEFDFWHSRAKTCGKECSLIYGKQLKELYKINHPDFHKKYHKRIYHKRENKEKICKICGNIFSSRGNHSLTCSEECRRKNIRINGNRNSHIWDMKHIKKKKEINHLYSINNREKLHNKAKMWRKKNPKKAIEYCVKWRENNLDKRNVEVLAQKKIKIPEGELCEICNERKAVHRHHEDYSKPLEVKFLCSRCHVNLHLNKRGKNSGS
jgi:hypothetical protein